MARHAEIAGGGIAGLTLGMMLARTGWSVRVHEQAPQIREVGAALFLRNNSLEVLSEFGIFDTLKDAGSELTRQLTVDRRGGIMEERELEGTARVWVIPRQALIDALRDAALAAGVEIKTSSMVVDALPDGTVISRELGAAKADLAVAADGIYSQIRARLGIPTSLRNLPTTINRYLIPSRDLPAEPFHVEHWGPNRRIGIAPAGPDWTYIYQVCSSQDAAGVQIPNNVEAWGESLPKLRHAFELFARSEVIQREYQVVRPASWSKGRVAMLGDAATGLPPTLGQGAGLAIMNARGLVAAVNNASSIEEGLETWESSIRFISDRTQAWACRFDVFANRWPNALWFLRWPVVWSFRSFPVFNERMRIAERGLSSTKLGQAG